MSIYHIVFDKAVFSVETVPYSWVLRSVSATKAHKMLTLNLSLLQAISKLTTVDGYQTKEWTFLNFNNNRHAPS